MSSKKPTSKSTKKTPTKASQTVSNVRTRTADQKERAKAKRKARIAAMTQEEKEAARAARPPRTEAQKAARTTAAARAARPPRTEAQKAARTTEAAKAARRQTRPPRTAAQKAARTSAAREKRSSEQVDFSLLDSDSITENAFYGFEQNPETAALLYHFNSGHDRFRSMEKLLSARSGSRALTQARQELLNEIADEALSIDERNGLMKDFLLSQGCEVPPGLRDNDGAWQGEGIPPSVDAPMLVCGACGFQSVQERHGQVCTVVALGIRRGHCPVPYSSR